jgi:dCMP deaminase
LKWIYFIIQYSLFDIRNSGLKKHNIMSDTKEATYTRPTWDEYFMEVMDAISKRATCNRGRSGCVIAKDNQILVTGYVGSPVGLPHCDEVGHQMKKTIHEDGTVTEHCVRTVHAEQNAICQAAKRGVALNGATLYCRMTPCRVCAMLIINCGITKVVCQRKYHAGTESEEMFKTAGVKLGFFYEEVQQYEKQK